MKSNHVFQTEYPRPQFVREHWQNLNGTWKFAFDDEKVGRQDHWYQDEKRFLKDDTRKIIVPFSYESEASGIGEREPHESVWYQRSFELAEDYKVDEQRVILHLDGADYESKVWLNGQHVDTRFGGQHRHSFDLSDYVIQGENLLTIECRDDYDPAKARGKQRWIPENYGCWYTQTSGLWKTVWLEYVPKTSIERFEIHGDFDQDTIKLKLFLAGARPGIKATVRLFYGDIKISEKALYLQNEPYPSAKTEISFELPLADRRCSPWGVHYWSPKNPNLYDLEFELSEDEEILDQVKSYYGHRKIEFDQGIFRLNGHPYFMKLILNQGYWEDSLLTCPNDEAIKHDIQYLKDAGFNGMRIHQKVEDERFIHFCDTMGLLVWSEMAANYVFDPESASHFVTEWMSIVQQYKNFPSIVAWTPFNESWGVPKVYWREAEQALTLAVYEMTHALDGTRPVISNDGWEHTISDILTLHDYEEDADKFLERYWDLEAIVNNDYPMNLARYAYANGFGYYDEPVVLSEYGGIAFATEGKEWGYGKNVESLEAFEKRLGRLHDAITECAYFSGVCYTQLTDVEQEVNGLLKMNHEVKIPAEVMKRLMDRLR